MKRGVLIGVGLALCSAAVVIGCLSLYELGRIGTCASGGAYEIARPCPPGTATHGLLLMASIFGGLIGAGIYAAGARGVRSALGLGVLLWALTFVGLAGAMALAAFGPAAPDTGGGAQIAAIVLLVVFVPMGIAPLLFAGLGSAGARRARSAGLMGGTAGGDAAGGGTASIAGLPASPGPPPESPPPRPPPRPAPPPPRTAPPSAPPAGASDTLAQLERLGELRRSGALTEEEFARLKSELLGE